jgi:hypothetical protein
MERQHLRTRILEIIGGTALAAAGIHILLENLECVGGKLKEALCGIAGVGLGILPSIVLAGLEAMQAYGLDYQRHLECLVQLLLSFWPLLFAVAGAR